MKKLIFSSLVDAVLNRVGGIVSNMLLRRLAMHAAQSEAADLAMTEEQLKELKEKGHTASVMRLESFLQTANQDDPSFAIGTSFSRQLLADSIETDTAEMRGEPGANGKPPGKRRGRKPKALALPQAETTT